MIDPYRQLRHRLLLLLPAIIAVAVLAACSGQPPTDKQPGSLNVTSAPQIDGLNYVLTGTVSLPDDQPGKLEYNLNETGWQPVNLGAGNSFSITLTLRQGRNTIVLALTTAEGVRTQQDFQVTASTDDGEGEPDTSAPEFLVTSEEESLTQDYLLEGAVLDNVGAVAATYSFNSAEPVALELNPAGRFEQALTLQPGANQLDLIALDAAGNEGSTSFTVTYLPQIAGVQVEPMVARGGEPVTITGSNFGRDPGTLTFGDQAAQDVVWTDTVITASVPTGSTGWLDVTVTGSNNSVIVSDFFAGVEVHDSAELVQWLLDEEGHGTALLLSGGPYEIEEPVENSGVFIPHAAYSLYGARTDGAPVTVLELPPAAYLLTSRDFGVQLQDLRIVFEHVLTLNHVQPDSSTTTSVPAGLHFNNLEIVGRKTGEDDGTFYISPLDGPGGAPVAVTMRNVHAWRMTGMSMVAQDVLIQDSMFEPWAAMTIQTNGGPLQLLDSQILEAAAVPGTMRLYIYSGEDTLVTRNEIIAGEIVFAQDIGDATFIDNEIEAWRVFLGGAGRQVLDDNRIDLWGNLLIGSEDATLSNNKLDFSMSGIMGSDGNVTISDNEITFSRNVAGQYAFSFAPLVDALNVTFNRNSVSGTDWLFHFSAQAGNVSATLQDNTFEADLLAAGPGSVAQLDAVTQAGAIAASGNTWGNLNSAEDVLDLIELLNGSTDGAMTVNPG